MKLDENSVCPVVGEHFGKRMRLIPHDYLKYIHTQQWASWWYPEVVQYIDTRIKPIDHGLLADIDQTIKDMFFWKYITYPTTSQLIENLIRSVGATNVLEIGMYSGFTSLYMVRAVHPHGFCTSLDVRDLRRGDEEKPNDGVIFDRLEELGYFRFLKGSLYAYPEFCPDPSATIEALRSRAPYDFVFIDSSHVVPDTIKELRVLWTLTEPGAMFVFHDCDGWGNVANQMHRFVCSMVDSGHFQGLVVPTCHRMDHWEPCNLGVFRRTALDI